VATIIALISKKPSKTNLALKEWAVLLPTVHIVAVCFFLIGYCYGFMHHIIEFLSITDFLAASLRGVDQAYLLLFPPVLIYILRCLKLFDGGGRVGMAVVVTGLVIVLTIVLITLISQLPRITTQHRLEWLSIFIMLVLFLVAATSAALMDTPKFAGTFLACLVLFCLTLGFDKGLRDLDRSYEQASVSYGQCAVSPVAIIRPLGSGFLALSKTEGWIVIDASCQTKFRLPVRPAASPPRGPRTAITKP